MAHAMDDGAGDISFGTACGPALLPMGQCCFLPPRHSADCVDGCGWISGNFDFFEIGRFVLLLFLRFRLRGERAKPCETDQPPFGHDAASSIDSFSVERRR